MRLESIEHAKFRALAQIEIDKEKGVEAFEEYMKIAFPYLEAAKKRDRKQYLELLQKEIKQGALVVKPLGTGKAKSRLRTRVVERAHPRTKQELDRLYKKMDERFSARR
jgi:hypothetical protein